jgi:hypothetical protein
VNRQRLAGGYACACAIRAGTRLVPVGAEIKPGLSEIFGGRFISYVIDRDTLIVRQQKYIAQARNLTVKRLDTEPRSPQQLIHRIAMLAELAILNDDSGSQDRRVQAVVIHASPPGIENKGVSVRGATFRHTNKFPDVIHHEFGTRRGDRRDLPRKLETE